jgi:trehalose synthase
MREIEVPTRPATPLAPLVDPALWERFEGACNRAAEALDGGTLWHVNSTEAGGGVAELLRSLLGYVAGAGIPTRWVVIDGDEAFFDTTKRIHHLLHGSADGESLGDAERGRYEGQVRPQAEALRRDVEERDAVVLHDPQSVGMASTLASAGVATIWNCHVGVDEPNDRARDAWSFLRPYVDDTLAQVFSRSAYAWEGLDPDRVAVIPPCIDPLSAKNVDLGDAEVHEVLHRNGIVANGARAETIEGGPVPSTAPIVTQVSRWDPLKDPVGVLEGFAAHVDPGLGAHLVLAGPAEDSVADDPEADEVLAEVRSAREALPDEARARVHLASLPMDDLEENARIVNALQRRADVVVQKSLAEGFGLTVAEAMWKARPVVGSRVGGIQDQIVDGEHGLLIDDPSDGRSLGASITSLLRDRAQAAELGRRAHDRVCEEYLPPTYLARHLELLAGVLAGDGAR